MSKALVNSNVRTRVFAAAIAAFATTVAYAQSEAPPPGAPPMGEVPPLPPTPPSAGSGTSSSTGPGEVPPPPPPPPVAPSESATGDDDDRSSTLDSSTGTSTSTSGATSGTTGGGSTSFPPPPGPQGKLLNRITRSPTVAPEAMFGSYRVRIALLRPEFTDLKFYDKLYGKEKMYPEIQADWFAFDWWATLGLSLRGGYYKADGKAAKDINKPIDQITSEDVVKDENGPTELTLIPLQALAIAEFSPFRQKWIVLEAWYGWEWLYFQEARTTKDKATSMIRRPSFGSLMQTSTTTSSDSEESLANKGWKNNMVLGGGVNLLLNPLDEMSANSMRGSMRLGYVYLSPFIEYVKSIDKGASFSRTVMGLGFTFESIY